MLIQHIAQLISISLGKKYTFSNVCYNEPIYNDQLTIMGKLRPTNKKNERQINTFFEWSKRKLNDISFLI